MSRSTVLFLCIASLLVVTRGYDIKAIEDALSISFSLEQGVFNLFNISNCQYLPSCFGNNPQSPYVEYNFSSWGGSSGPILSDEAIVVIQARPPSCRYFGYTPYLISRHNGVVPKILFASLSDTLNLNEVNIGSDGTIALVSSPNTNITNYILSILNKFLLPNSTNILPLPGSQMNLGLSPTSDTIGYLSRFALFQNPTQGLQYLNNIPGYVYKLTPKSADTSPLFPYPSFKPYGPTSKNENNLQNSLNQLVSAIKASESGIALVQPAIDIEHLLDYQDGFTCINKSIDCSGDNRDARYLRAGTIYIQNSTDSHTWVAGVQHQATGKATYIAVAAYDEAHMLGVVSVPDVKMAGSAQVFLPNNPDAQYLYAIKFARTCAPTERFCFVVPVNFPGVPLDLPMSFTERVYLEPGYNVAPAYGSILPPQFIRYRSMGATKKPVQIV